MSMSGQSQTVGALMTADVVTVGPDAPFKQVVQALAERGVDAAPVVDQTGALLGVVSGSDLTCHEEEPPGLPAMLGRSAREHARKARARTAGELMSSPARTVSPQAEVREALHEMARGKVGRLVVVDEGRVVGILTRSDVLRIYLRSDADLQQEVEAAVAAHIVCPHELQVAVADGVVHLRGWVERSSCEWAAAAAARAVLGVVDLEDEVSCTVDDTVVHEMSVRGPFL